MTVGYGDKKEYSASEVKTTTGYVKETIEDVLTYPFVAIPERGLTKSTCKYFGIRCRLNELDEVERIYFPYHKEEGSIGSGEFYVSGYKVKDLTQPKKAEKGKRSYHFTTIGDTDDECLLFGIAQSKSFSNNRVVLCEGEMDAAAFWESCVRFHKQAKELDKAKKLIVLSIGFGTASALKHISNERNQYYLEKVDHKILCFDNDECTDEELKKGMKKGKEAIKEVITCYPEYKVANTRWELNDANDMHLAGRHSDLFWSMMKPDDYTSDSFVDPKQYQDQLIMLPQLGRLWPWESMNRITLGKQRGAGYYIGSGVGQGKTELLNKLVAFGIEQDDPPFALFKFEEDPEVTLRKQMGMMQGYKFHDPSKVIHPGNVDVWGDPIPPGARGYFTEEDLFNAKCEFDEDSVIIYNTERFPEWERIKADIRYATVVRGSKDVVLDPLTSLFEGIDAGEANRLLAEIARDLYLMSNDIGFNFYVTCHLNAPKFGPPHEEGGKVHGYQFTGSKAMMRAAVGQWGLERNRREDLPRIIQNMSWMNCLKDRVYGNTGGFHLYYDPETGSYEEPSESILEEYMDALAEVKAEKSGRRPKSPTDFTDDHSWVEHVKEVE